MKRPEHALPAFEFSDGFAVAVRGGAFGDIETACRRFSVSSFRNSPIRRCISRYQISQGTFAPRRAALNAGNPETGRKWHETQGSSGGRGASETIANALPLFP